MEECKKKQEELQVNDLLAMIQNRKYGNRYQSDDKKVCIIEDPDCLTINFHQMERMMLHQKREKLLIKFQKLFERRNKENQVERESLSVTRKRKGKGDRIFYSLILGIAVFASYHTLKAHLVKEQKEKLLVSLEKQVDAAIEDFDLTEILGEKVLAEEILAVPLGSLLEDYLGIDLDEEKVRRLDRLGSIALEKYYLDSGEGYLNSPTNYYDISSYVEDTIYYDNPELSHYNINVEDGYLYANGEYKIVDSSLYQYFLSRDYLLKELYDDLSFSNSKKEEMDLMIDTCLKATCYGVLLDKNKGELDFSLTKLAKENNYTFPPITPTEEKVCEREKVRAKKRNL